MIVTNTQTYIENILITDTSDSALQHNKMTMALSTFSVTSCSVFSWSPNHYKGRGENNQHQRNITMGVHETFLFCLYSHVDFMNP